VSPPAQSLRSRCDRFGPSPDAGLLAARAVAVLALVLVVSLGPGAASTREAVGAEAVPPKVIRLVANNISLQVLVDKPPSGASKGDTIYTANVLANAIAQFGQPKDAVVGADGGRMTNLDAAPMTVNILVKLPGGSLRVRGRSRVVSLARVMPVVAGTGQFKGATGTLTVKEIPHTGEFSNVYRLRYP
jgi:hypothetical protein